MLEVRCKGCNKLLAKANVIVGAIKCTSCKMIFEYKEFDDMYMSSTFDKKDLQLKDRYDIKDTEPPSS
jgi:phage FluMu protein Com